MFSNQIKSKIYISSEIRGKVFKFIFFSLGTYACFGSCFMAFVAVGLEVYGTVGTVTVPVCTAQHFAILIEAFPAC